MHRTHRLTHSLFAAACLLTAVQIGLADQGLEPQPAEDTQVEVEAEAAEAEALEAQADTTDAQTQPDDTEVEVEVEVEVETEVEVEAEVEAVDTQEPSASDAATEPANDNDTTDTPVASQAQPETTGLDRSGWPVIVITPADGTVTHHPHFMGDPPMGDDEISPLHAPNPVWQIQEALAGAKSGNLNGENLSALGAQPFIGLAQFLAIPFRAVLDNPLSEATSP